MTVARAGHGCDVEGGPLVFSSRYVLGFLVRWGTRWHDEVRRCMSYGQVCMASTASSEKVVV